MRGGWVKWDRVSQANPERLEAQIAEFARHYDSSARRDPRGRFQTSPDSSHLRPSPRAARDVQMYLLARTFDWTAAELAEQFGLAPRTVQRALARGQRLVEDRRHIHGGS